MKAAFVTVSGTTELAAAPLLVVNQFTAGLDSKPD